MTTQSSFVQPSSKICLIATRRSSPTESAETSYLPQLSRSKLLFAKSWRFLGLLADLPEAEPNEVRWVTDLQREGFPSGGSGWHSYFAVFGLSSVEVVSVSIFAWFSQQAPAISCNGPFTYRLASGFPLAFPPVL